MLSKEQTDEEASRIARSIRDRKALAEKKLEDEEYRERKAREHQEDIDDAFGNY